MFEALTVEVATRVEMSIGGASNAADMNALLLRVAMEGDREAFGALFDYFAPRLKSYLMKIGAAPELAEDLAQEAMLKVWRKARLFDPSRASASTWIFTIARNLRIDAARRAARPDLDANDPSLAPSEPPRADAVLEQSARDARIRAAFETLPPAQLEVVRLHFIEDAAHSEIAARLNLPLGTIKSRLRLAFEKIRKEIGDSVE